MLRRILLGGLFVLFLFFLPACGSEEDAKAKQRSREIPPDPGLKEPKPASGKAG